MRGAAILMYHGIGAPPRPERTGARYHIEASALAAQLAALGELEAAGRPVISLDRMLAGGDGVVLTFDDGEASCRQAADAIATRGWSATIYVTSGFMDTAGYLTAADVRALARDGFTIGAHGATHRYLTDLDDRELDAELRGAREVLERAAGVPVLHLALPGGRGDARVAAAARRAGYASLATSRVGLNPSGTDRFALRRVAVVDDLGLRRFAALARGDTRAYARDQLVGGVLDTAKKVLGNRRYEAWRGLALKLLGKS